MILKNLFFLNNFNDVIGDGSTDADLLTGLSINLIKIHIAVEHVVPVLKGHGKINFN